MHDQEMSLAELMRLGWRKRKVICLCSVCGLAAGLAVACLLPKRYTARVQFVAESEQGGFSTELSGLGSLLGLPSGTLRRGEVLSADLYPDIVAGTPFLSELCADELKGKTALETDRILRHRRKTIDVFTDHKSGLTTVSVTDKIPAVAAAAADSVIVRLERMLIGTRTGKARADLLFVEARFEEAKANYYAAQEARARFVDKNRYLSSESAAVERERLDNDRQLSYTVFQQLSNRLELARIRVQEQTPVLTVIEPAAVPVRPTFPRRNLFALAGLLIGALIPSGWIAGREIFGNRTT
jgi:uncharacterized protein involved in exopolysaccharide biosynthesis